jgi:putative SOS response-associated peptidase YedK
MCGRFTVTLQPDEFQLAFDLGDFPVDLAGRFNVAPTQPVAVVRDAASRVVESMRWGLIPSWAKDESIASRLINARSETLAEKPSFRNAFARRRCLILADGFYEWQKLGGKAPAQPYYFQLLEGKPFAFAGLWESWRTPDGSDRLTCTIITTSANDLIRPYHERMPVMLTGDGLWQWLAPADTNALSGLLAPFPAAQMTARPVSRLVNSAGVDSPRCLDAA